MRRLLAETALLTLQRGGPAEAAAGNTPDRLAEQ